MNVNIALSGFSLKRIPYLIDKKRLIQGLLFGVVAAFFIWQSVNLGDWFHTVAAGVYIIFTILVLVGRIDGRLRANALNIGISLLFLDWVFAGLPLDQVGAELASANFWLMIPSVLALGVHLFFRIWRWQVLLKPMADISFGPAFRAGMIGIGGNMVLPARAGEFLRAYVIGRSSNISKTGAFATLVVERIFDGLTVLTFLVLLFVFGVSDSDLRPYAIAGATFYAIALGGIVVFILWQSWFETILIRILPTGLSNKLMPILQGFSSGLEALQDPKQLGMVILLSFLTWGFIPLSFYPILAAFDYGVPLPVFAAILMVPMLAFGLMIPGAPGGIGPFELFGEQAMLISFQIAGTPIDEQGVPIVVASVVLLHVSQAVPEALLGIWAFFKEGLTTRDLQAGQEV